MPLNSTQIITLACQIAKCPGFTAQAGELLNSILSELCQTYDFDAARGPPYIFTFNGLSGPYPLPADYLRMRKGKSFYMYNGQPYFMNYIELEEYEGLVQQLGFHDFPRNITVDMADVNPAFPYGGEFDVYQFDQGFAVGGQSVHRGVPNAYVWPPPSIAVPVTIHYYRQMPDIALAATSSQVPWFPYQNYLIRRLAGELMTLTDDDRAGPFLTGDEKQNPQGAGVLLRKFLMMKDDPEGRAKTVELDKRFFGTPWNMLPNTKNIGW